MPSHKFWMWWDLVVLWGRQVGRLEDSIAKGLMVDLWLHPGFTSKLCHPADGQVIISLGLGFLTLRRKWEYFPHRMAVSIQLGHTSCSWNRVWRTSSIHRMVSSLLLIVSIEFGARTWQSTAVDQGQSYLEISTIKRGAVICRECLQRSQKMWHTGCCHGMG